MKAFQLIVILLLSITTTLFVSTAASHIDKNNKFYTVLDKNDTSKTNKPGRLASSKPKSKKVDIKSNRKKSKRSGRHFIHTFKPNPPENDCVLTTKYTVAQRLKKYPFSMAAKIEAVSFRYMDRRRDILIGDSVKIYDDGIRSKLPDSLLNKNSYENKYESGLHIEHQILNYSSLLELRELDDKQIDKLTDLIFNTTVKKKINNYADPGFDCYQPRNALVFYDKNGIVYDFLEICFECERYRSLLDKISIGSNCNQKFDLLKQFFIDIGIQFGTIKKS
jgi:hypothetical protein